MGGPVIKTDYRMNEFEKCAGNGLQHEPLVVSC